MEKIQSDVWKFNNMLTSFSNIFFYGNSNFYYFNIENSLYFLYDYFWIYRKYKSSKKNI